MKKDLCKVMICASCVVAAMMSDSSATSKEIKAPGIDASYDLSHSSATPLNELRPREEPVGAAARDLATGSCGPQPRTEPVEASGSGADTAVGSELEAGSATPLAPSPSRETIVNDGQNVSEIRVCLNCKRIMHPLFELYRSVEDLKELFVKSESRIEDWPLEKFSDEFYGCLDRLCYALATYSQIPYYIASGSDEAGIAAFLLFLRDGVKDVRKKYDTLRQTKKGRNASEFFFDALEQLDRVDYWLRESPKLISVVRRYRGCVETYRSTKKEVVAESFDSFLDLLPRNIRERCLLFRKEVCGD